MTELNTYEQQLIDKGYSLSEIRRPGEPLTLTDANKHGFETVEDYREALHDFLNGQ